MNPSAKRARWIAIATVALLCVCALRLFTIQIIQGPSLAAEGQLVRTRMTDIPAKRGAILDVTGAVLADSVQTYHIAVNQVNIMSAVRYVEKDGVPTKEVEGRGPAMAARLLAPLLAMDEATLGGMMIGDSTYVYLKKHVDAQTYREIRKLNIHGIEWEAVHERIYPAGNTAGQLIGSVNADNAGSAGMEATMNDLLVGTPGKEAYEIAPNGAVMPGGKKVIEEPIDGASVRTTLYADLQHLVQDKLDAKVQESQSDWGSVVILDVATGRVLVMADSGAKEPESSTIQTASSVQYAFEPGSVGKVLTVAAALQKGTITPTTTFEVPDNIARADSGGVIKDIRNHPTYQLTSTGILAQSSNVGTVLIGETLTNDELYNMMSAFGLGTPTGIELPGETAGSLRTPDQWQGRDKYVTMFGQAYSMSALQEASVMATIGNGGVRVNPRIIDSWTKADGTVHYPESPEPVQVISPEVAQQLTLMMESVVEAETGTGSKAQIDGYRVALKTGTAELFLQNGTGVVATAAGIVPADNPRLAISVVLYNPKSTAYGGTVAAPLFGDAASDAVRTLGIPASSEPAQLYPTGREEN
ncbi:peptidoglycan D,D-transpeptidase FtsI family protein [Schaalia suimastitidis]|uniref:peptidoglycan D,D-transpeptidase FtsI family protein n=1 Tax=Schaalia suimastitidis TaxID=121163 RepID=UPI0004008BF2|nr:penicillin-binding protein 2 [Schaalia suimastitidis]